MFFISNMALKKCLHPFWIFSKVWDGKKIIFYLYALRVSASNEAEDESQFGGEVIHKYNRVEMEKNHKNSN